MPSQDGRREILEELTDRDYGSREFICRDPEGNVWSFGTYWPKANEPASVSVRERYRARPKIASQSRCVSRSAAISSSARSTSAR